MTVERTPRFHVRSAPRLLVIAILVLVLLSCGFIVGGKIPLDNRETEPPAEIPKVDELREKFRSAMIVDADENTSVNLTLPKCDDASLNELIRQYAEYIIYEFRKGITPDEHAVLNVTYELFFRDNNIFSVLYSTCVVRGEQEQKNNYTAIYNYEKKQQYAFQDLFRADSDYLDAVSAKVKEKIDQKGLMGEAYDEESVDAATQPESKNLERVVLTENDLLFVFPPDTISENYTETLEVAVPTSELSEQFFLQEPSLSSYELPTEPPTEAPTEPPTEPPTDPPTEPPTEAPPVEKPQSSGGLLALTFDDGPSDQTARLLDALAERGVKATFYLVGNRISSYPNTVRRLVNEGHSIGSHTYSHAKLTKLSQEEGLAQITDTDNVLMEVAGATCTTIRPPYGAFNDTLKSYAPYPLIMWSVDPEDWRTKDSDVVSQRIIEKAKDGDIILLHDLYATSVDAGIKVIDQLQAQGFEFVTVPELLERKGNPGVAGKVYFSAFS